jgi:hypothetical protein
VARQPEFLFGDLGEDKVAGAYDRAIWILGDHKKATDAVRRAVSLVLIAKAKQEEHIARLLRSNPANPRASNRAHLNLYQIFDLLVMQQLTVEKSVEQEMEVSA